jgi:hypothetical protein
MGWFYHAVYHTVLLASFLGQFYDTVYGTVFSYGCTHKRLRAKHAQRLPHAKHAPRNLYRLYGNASRTSCYAACVTGGTFYCTVLSDSFIVRFYRTVLFYSFIGQFYCTVLHINAMCRCRTASRASCYSASMLHSIITSSTTQYDMFCCILV